MRTMIDPVDSDLWGIVGSGREFLLEKWRLTRITYGWPQEHDQSASHGMCLFSACFLRFVFRRQFDAVNWRVVAGCPDDPDVIDPLLGTPGGFLGPSGCWHGHHWVENTQGTITADVTLDQFGGPAVWVGDPRCIGGTSQLRRNWHTKAEDAASECVAAEVCDWMRDWETWRCPRKSR